MCWRFYNYFFTSREYIDIAKTCAYLSVYFVAVAFLFLAYQISRTGFTNELTDVLVTKSGQFIRTCHQFSQCSSELLFSKATKVIKVVANSSCCTMHLIQIEFFKAYLYRVLRCIKTLWLIVSTTSKCLLGSFVLHNRTIPDNERLLYTGAEVIRSLTVQFTSCTRKTIIQNWRWH